MVSLRRQQIVATVLMLMLAISSLCFGQFNYKEALEKSIIFLECQRSGKLPPNQRVKWRGDSALKDGRDQGVDLSGGYYDAGDNIKFGFPMAFTITMLSWGVIRYDSEYIQAGQMRYALDAIKWGTDYFLKCSNTPNTLYVQVGDPDADHKCWQRPEDMDTPRTVLKIDQSNPGSEIAAETSAALASAAIAFSKANKQYSEELLTRAKSLFEFADKYKGTFKGECPFYCSSSGYTDELLWAAAWLYKATDKSEYLEYINKNWNTNSFTNEFSWDLKYAGVQILLLSMDKPNFVDYKQYADSFVCSMLPGSPMESINKTPGGLLHLRDGANLQYAINAAFLFNVYGDALANKGQGVKCKDKEFKADDLFNFAKSQVDYLLGNNPEDRSYMVGYGKNPPQHAHHRGASSPSIHSFPNKIGCGEGYVKYANVKTPNPNLLMGAIVGGPDSKDIFKDNRKISPYTEPCTYVNSALSGTLAKLSAQS